MKKFNPENKIFSATAGFTLVEFAIVMLISGLLMMSGLQTYKAYLKKEKMDTTYVRLDDAANMISQAWNLEQRYFCPADPSLQPTDPNYGIEKCPDPAVTAEGSCDGGVCRGAGAREGGIGNDAVLVGMFPYRTIFNKYEEYIAQAFLDYQADPTNVEKLTKMQSAARTRVRLSAQASLDGWGNQMTYIVTESMTNAGLFENRTGTIRIVDENNIENSKDGVHYALISYGENALGSYNAYGKRPFPCPAVPAVENENCNDDGLLIRPVMRSYAEGVGRMDDILRFTVTVDSELWSSTSCSGGSGRRDCIRNTNKGNVGIGTDNPLEKLHVLGSVRTDKIYTPEICGDMGDDGTCFTPDRIGGTVGMVCDPAVDGLGRTMVVQAIKNGEVICGPVMLQGAVTPGTYCPPNQYVVGFTGTGGLQCAPM